MAKGKLFVRARTFSKVVFEFEVFISCLSLYVFSDCQPYPSKDFGERQAKSLSIGVAKISLRIISLQLFYISLTIVLVQAFSTSIKTRLLWAGVFLLLICLPCQAKPQPHIAPSVPLKNGYKRVDFKTLSGYTFTPKPLKDLPPEENQHYWDNQIPNEIMRLKGDKVQIEGYLFALELDGFKVKVGFLLPYQLGCHFHRPPRVHEILHITVAEGSREELSFKPVVLWGTIEMGDKVMEETKGGSLYHLHVESMKNVEDAL